MEILSVFSMACNPVINVLLTCAVGTIIARPPINAFDKNARKSLNKLVFIVFTPALVFARLASALTLQNLFKWWYIPCNVVLCYLIGACLGYAVVIIAKPPQHLNRLTIASCAAGNAGNLPLVLVPSLCSQKRSPFGATSVCLDLGVSYISFGMCIAIVLTWTFIYNLLKPDRSSIQSTSESPVAPEGFRPIELIEDSTPLGQTTTVVSTTDVPFPNSTELELEPLDIGPSTRTEHTLPDKWHKPTVQNAPSPHHPLTIMQRVSQGALPPVPSPSALKRVFTPPTSAALLGFIVGAVPPIKYLFFSGPLSVLKDSSELLGGAMIPAMMLVLGGNLSEGTTDSDMQPVTIAGIVVVRLIVLPIIGIFVVQVAASLGFLIPGDKMFHFVLLMQFTVPTAMNIGTVAQLHGFGEKESSIVLFWCYMLSIIALTIWITIYLWLLF